MRPRPLHPLLLLVAVLAGCAKEGRPPEPTAPPSDFLLRGEMRAKPGTILRTTSAWTSEGVSSTVGPDQIGLTSSRSDAETSVSEAEVVAAPGGGFKLRKTYISQWRTASVQFPVSPKSMDFREPGPLHGSVVLLERANGRWQASLHGKHPTPEQATALRRLSGFYNAQVYPDRGVKVGETWRLGPEIVDFILGAALASSGSGTMTLEAVKTVNGERQAHLAVELRGKGSVLTAEHNEESFDFNLSGNIVRSLDHFTEVELKLSGPFKGEREVVAGMRLLRTKATGTMKIESVTTVR